MVTHDALWWPHMQSYMSKMELMTVQKMPRQLFSCIAATRDCRQTRSCMTHWVSFMKLDEE